MGSSTDITSGIDLAAPGKHCGYLRLPHSVHRSAYGFIPMPIVSIKSGSGPKLLLMAGNHGDEYEGQIALAELARELQAEDVSGHLIILPMANTPAARAGLRTSPIDDGNLNRSFANNVDGGVTERIAHYIETVLLQDCQWLLDLHSGGSSLVYESTAMTALGDGHDRQVREDGLMALGLPNALFYPGDPTDRYSSSAALRQGAIGITAEIGGGGTVTPATLGLLRRGLRNFLHHAGALDARFARPVSPGRLLHCPGGGFYCHTGFDGLFEPLHELGDTVKAGERAALIHNPFNPADAPREVQFAESGIVICVRQPARVEHGDCLYQLASPLDRT